MSEARCRVCQHPDRSEIDAALVAGLPNAQAATRWGMSKDSVRRHVSGHLSEALKAMRDGRDDAGPRKALDRAESLYGKANAILDAAQADGKPGLSLTALRELRSTVELIARMTGELDERPTVQVLNVQASPEWSALRGVLLAALRPYPDAARAVAGALAGAGVSDE